MAEVTQALRETVRRNPHIKNVFFTAAGSHYFHVHPFKGKSYGSLKIEAVEVGKDGDRPVYKMQAIENPDEMIVETMPRDNVLTEAKK